VVTYDRSHEIDADSLENGLYRNLIEADGYPLTSYPHCDRDYEVVPWNAQDWSYEDVLDHMKRPLDYEEQGAKRIIHRWERGTEITAYVYDEQIFDVNCEEDYIGCYVDSNDENLLASKEYIENSIRAYELLNEKIEDITITVNLQSESEEQFPQRYGATKNAIYIAGQPGAPYPITQRNATENGAFYLAYAMQQTDPPAPRGYGGGELSDAEENVGPSTTGQGSKTVNYDTAQFTPFGEKLLPFWYDYPIGTGEYARSIAGRETVHNNIPLYIPNPLSNE
jgi:hypothetical protein